MTLATLVILNPSRCVILSTFAPLSVNSAKDLILLRVNSVKNLRAGSAKSLRTSSVKDLWQNDLLPELASLLLGEWGNSLTLQGTEGYKVSRS